MALELKHVLAGERVRTAEKYRNPLIDHVTGTIAKGAKRGEPRFEIAPEYCPGDSCDARTADTDYPKTTDTWRGGNGNDGVSNH